jgi:hypothetical protein
MFRESGISGAFTSRAVIGTWRGLCGQEPPYRSVQLADRCNHAARRVMPVLPQLAGFPYRTSPPYALERLIQPSDVGKSFCLGEAFSNRGD